MFSGSFTVPARGLVVQWSKADPHPLPGTGSATVRIARVGSQISRALPGLAADGSCRAYETGLDRFVKSAPVECVICGCLDIDHPQELCQVQWAHLVVEMLVWIGERVSQRIYLHKPFEFCWIVFFKVHKLLNHGIELLSPIAVV